MKVNTIQHNHDDEPVSDWRSLDLRKETDQRGATTRSPAEGDGVVGGSRSGKESAVNAGDLPGQEAERLPAEVRDAIRAQASRGKHEPGETGVTERSRVAIGGAKGVRKANPESERSREIEPAEVPETGKQAGEDLWQRCKAERGVWSQGMLEALERGVKGGKWFSLIDKVYSEKTRV